MNEYTSLNDNTQNKDKKIAWNQKGSGINDLKSNIQIAKDKFNERRAQSDSIFKSSSQILNNE